uniref:Major intrinsic protein n=1 Tax=viral metagenome TaxID=1070528 RepID=A0A6C0JWC6_9ZZZZ
MHQALVEFLGTALLVGTVAFTGTPVLIVAALAVAIGLGGKISGGHFNPAVTAWALLEGKIGQNKAMWYIASQLFAAVSVWGLHSLVKV